MSGSTATRAKQRTQEKGVLFVHVAVAIAVNPPTTAEIANVAGTELCLWPKLPHGQLLEPTFHRQFSEQDGVKKLALGGYLDDRTTATSLVRIVGQRARRHHRRQGENRCHSYCFHQFHGQAP